MKAFVARLNTNAKYARAIQWGKLITITGSAQILIQALGFFSGILIIRLLSTEEYAWYTLANTMLGTMIMLADSGISNGVMAESGKVWQDKEKLGVTIATGLDLRRKYGLVSLLVITPVLVKLLFDHGANWLTIILIIISIVPAFYAALSDSILEIVPKLHQVINPLQKNQVQVSLGRLFLILSIVLLVPYTFIILIANSIPRIYGNFKLRKISAPFIDNNQKPDALVRKQVNKSVNRTLPIVIYSCISGQLSIWLISLFGTTANISQLGALGRLAMLFNLFTSLFSTLIVPRFARMQPLKDTLLKRFLLIQASTFVISTSLLILVWLFSNQILWILGPKYSHLNCELLLVGISSCIVLMATVSSQLIVSRGWYFNPYILIAFNFGTTVISLTFLNLSSFKNILYFDIIINIISYTLGICFGIFNIRKLKSIAPF